MSVAIVLLVVILSLVAAGAVISKILKVYRRKAQHAGHASLGDYLRAVPHSDEEKRDAVDLALKGLVICVAGLLFPPLLLIGLIPFYYGARKVAYAAMGFGLFEDAEPPSA